jgi:hypothetical protein
MTQGIDKIVYLVEQSALDETIKQILIRDLQKDGLTDFLREQIKAYCFDEIKKLDSRIEEAKKLLSAEEQNPS